MAPHDGVGKGEAAEAEMGKVRASRAVDGERGTTTIGELVSQVADAGGDARHRVEVAVAKGKCQ